MLSPLHYGDSCKKLIKNIKYHYRHALIEDLARLIRPFVQAHSERLQDFTLVPIPLHHRRERIRGFNQAEKIARLISSASGLKVNDCLLRKKNTAQQAKLKRDQRRQNLAHAFDLKSISVPNKIILVDDVYSSGATLTSAAKTLRTQVENPDKIVIGGLTIARSPLSGIIRQKQHHDHWH